MKEFTWIFRLDFWKGLKERLKINLNDTQWNALLDVLIDPELENMILVDELTSVLSYYGINKLIGMEKVSIENLYAYSFSHRTQAKRTKQRLSLRI